MKLQDCVDVLWENTLWVCLLVYTRKRREKGRRVWPRDAIECINAGIDYVSFHYVDFFTCCFFLCFLVVWNEKKECFALDRHVVTAGITARAFYATFRSFYWLFGVFDKQIEFRWDSYLCGNWMPVKVMDGQQGSFDATAQRQGLFTKYLLSWRPMYLLFTSPYLLRDQQSSFLTVTLRLLCLSKAKMTCE